MGIGSDGERKRNNKTKMAAFDFSEFFFVKTPNKVRPDKGKEKKVFRDLSFLYRNRILAYVAIARALHQSRRKPEKTTKPHLRFVRKTPENSSGWLHGRHLSRGRGLARKSTRGEAFFTVSVRHNLRVNSASTGDSALYFTVVVRLSWTVGSVGSRGTLLVVYYTHTPRRLKLVNFLRRVFFLFHRGVLRVNCCGVKPPFRHLLISDLLRA